MFNRNEKHWNIIWINDSIYKKINFVIWNREQLNKICKLNRGYFGDTNFIIFVQFIVGCSKACLKEIFDIKRLSEILKNKKDKSLVVEFTSAIRINMPEH